MRYLWSIPSAVVAWFVAGFALFPGVDFSTAAAAGLSDIAACECAAGCCAKAALTNRREIDHNFLMGNLQLS